MSSDFMKLKMECLRLASQVAVAHKHKTEAIVPAARVMFAFLIEGSEQDEVIDDDPVQYVGNHPRNLVHMLDGKQIWPKVDGAEQ